MGKPDDISSTEKLLEMIRLNQGAQAMESGAPEPGQPIAAVVVNAPPDLAKKARPAAPKAILPCWPTGKAVVVGIDLQAAGIGLVLAAPVGKRPAPLKARFIPFDLPTPLPEAGLLPALLTADWFPALLQKALADFCGSNRKIAYWCALPREAVETHNITIPKVPDQEVGNTVFWTTVKEIAFDQEAMLLDFQMVKEVQADSGARMLAIVYLAARREIEGLEEIFTRIGHPLTGMASSSAASHNELRQAGLVAKGENFVHLFLGEEKSYIALFSEGRLIFRRDINTGISSLIESLMEKAADQGVILDEAGCRSLLFSDQAASNTPDALQGLITEDQSLFDLELPAAVRLIRQMERTLDYCKNHYAVPRASRILLDGVSFASSGLAAYFSHEIGIECLVHKPLAVAGSLKDHRLLTAFGIALSDRAATQNFLQTHEQKVQGRRIGRINNAMMAGTLVILLACFGLFLWQRVQIHAKETRLAALVTKIGPLPPGEVQETTDRLMASLRRIKQGQEERTTQARRFFPVAVAGEIISNLPKQIRLTSLDLEPGPARHEKAAASEQARQEKPAEAGHDYALHVAMQGIVMGQRQNLEFELARYLRTITASSVIQSARMAEKENGEYLREEVLRFKVDVNAAPPAAETQKIAD